jgi:hypothetical protein
VLEFLSNTRRRKKNIKLIVEYIIMRNKSVEKVLKFSLGSVVLSLFLDLLF